jgi:hypothetical protein
VTPGSRAWQQARRRCPASPRAAESGRVGEQSCVPAPCSHGHPKHCGCCVCERQASSQPQQKQSATLHLQTRHGRGGRISRQRTAHALGQMASTDLPRRLLGKRMGPGCLDRSAVTGPRRLLVRRFSFTTDPGKRHTEPHTNFKSPFLASLSALCIPHWRHPSTDHGHHHARPPRPGPLWLRNWQRPRCC